MTHASELCSRDKLLGRVQGRLQKLLPSPEALVAQESLSGLLQVLAEQLDQLVNLGLQIVYFVLRTEATSAEIAFKPLDIIASESSIASAEGLTADKLMLLLLLDPNVRRVVEPSLTPHDGKKFPCLHSAEEVLQVLRLPGDHEGSSFKDWLSGPTGARSNSGIVPSSNCGLERPDYESLHMDWLSAHCALSEVARASMLVNSLQRQANVGCGLFLQSHAMIGSLQDALYFCKRATTHLEDNIDSVESLLAQGRCNITGQGRLAMHRLGNSQWYSAFYNRAFEQYQGFSVRVRDVLSTVDKVAVHISNQVVPSVMAKHFQSACTHCTQALFDHPRITTADAHAETVLVDRTMLMAQNPDGQLADISQVSTTASEEGWSADNGSFASADNEQADPPTHSASINDSQEPLSVSKLPATAPETTRPQTLYRRRYKIMVLL